MIGRRGFTLAELLVSLSIFGLIVGLSAHGAAGQLRFFSGVSALADARTQTTQAGSIPTRLLQGVAPAAGDIVSATSTALEFHAVLGVAVACEDDIGSATILAGDTSPLTRVFRPPETGDRVHVHVADSSGGGWIETRVASVTSSIFACAGFPDDGATAVVALAHDFVVPRGSVLRFSRRMRLRHYRASDGDWYLGLQEWDGDSDRFAGIQPVAGPLSGPDGDPSGPGLRLEYLDRAGAPLSGSFDSGAITAVSIQTHSSAIQSGRSYGTVSSHIDSSMATISLRNAQ